MKISKLSFLVFVMLIPMLSFNQELKTNSKIISVNEWLYSGSLTVKMPLSNNDKDINGKAFNEKSLLKFNHINFSHFRPELNEKVGFTNRNWENLKSDKDGFINLKKNGKSKDYKIQYFVSYIEANRWLKAKLNVESTDMLEVYVDGKSIGGLYSSNGELETFKKELKLEKRNYTIIVKVLSKLSENKKIKFGATLILDDAFEQNDINISINPEYYMDIPHVLEGPRIKSIKVSADGKYFLADYSEVLPPEGKVQKWIEIYELQTKKLIRTIRDYKFGRIQWLPNGHEFSYTSGETLWLSDAASGKTEILVENISISSYQWSHDSNFIIYSVSENAPKKNELAQKYENMQDNWPWWRYRSFLYKLDIKTGVRQRLTFGNIATSLQDISSDGKRIIYSESIIDNLNRPFSKQYMYELELESFKLDTLWVKNFGGSVSYSPDGSKLLVSGSPVMFGEMGTNLQKQKIANDYDNQGYIFTLKDKSVSAITREFDPKIESAYWANDATIYFRVEEKTYKTLYEYNITSKSFEKIKTDQDILANINYSQKSNIAGYTSHGLNVPNKAYLLNLETNVSELVLDPEKEFFADVRFGKNEDWVYTKDDGTKIDGFIYYPPNFDATKKYPVIVYYYSGTSPINRSFRGRYPKELYTAHAYVVYVVNPSGATGYGQEFSAAHVNNWGVTVADEIIEATKYFTKEHAFVNEEKIGCMGASYGGFMTMLLMTKTDIFATGISHAGISSISSYWGEGYWGYLYSSTASANSYPWNNKELYVNQSALFNADKQENSLLLLHGGSDTNVPIGESFQLYTALKLLGKKVEFVKIPGEDHWILEYKKRIMWQKSITAWFDKELKDEPQWWNELYPNPNLK